MPVHSFIAQLNLSFIRLSRLAFSRMKESSLQNAILTVVVLNFIDFRLVDLRYTKINSKIKNISSDGPECKEIIKNRVTNTKKED